jgi:Protein of unknown function (DUF4031)
MTVYVDDFSAPYRRMFMSHMIADTEAELHAMADRIGVQRRWFQYDHYDISKGKRELAVRYGAVEITVKQAAGMRRRQQVEGHCGKPEEAWDWLKEYSNARQKRIRRTLATG